LEVSYGDEEANAYEWYYGGWREKKLTNPQFYGEFAWEI
jgi:hypothetical protein